MIQTNIHRKWKTNINYAMLLMYGPCFCLSHHGKRFLLAALIDQGTQSAFPGLDKNYFVAWITD